MPITIMTSNTLKRLINYYGYNDMDTAFGAYLLFKYPGAGSITTSSLIRDSLARGMSDKYRPKVERHPLTLDILRYFTIRQLDIYGWYRMYWGRISNDRT